MTGPFFPCIHLAFFVFFSRPVYKPFFMLQQGTKEKAPRLYISSVALDTHWWWKIEDDSLVFQTT